MAVSSTITTMPLDVFAEIVGLNPVHFNGGRGSLFWPFATPCDNHWKQYGWQTGNDHHVSREDLARLLRTAEREIAQMLGFPSRVESFVETVPINARTGIFTVKQRHVQRIGAHVPLLLAANAPIVTSDADSDTFVETCTVTVTLSSAPAFSTTDVYVTFAGHGSSAAWRIRPITVTLNGLVLTITFPIWLSVHPELVNTPPADYPAEPIDMDDEDSFVAEVDVWADIITPTVTNAAGDIFAVTSDPFAFLNGQVSIDWSSCRWTGVHQHVIVNYDAGLLEPDPVLDWTVACLAVTRMPTTPCDCNTIRSFYEEWHRDLTSVGGGALSMAVISNPFGFRVGETQVWNRLIRLGLASEWGAGAV